MRVMMSDLVLVEIEERICTLTLNRPEVLNALNVGVFQQLDEALQSIINRGQEVACVVLRGAGKAFSAGHDLNDISAGDESTHADFEAAVLETRAFGPASRSREILALSSNGSGSQPCVLAASLIEWI